MSAAPLTILLANSDILLRDLLADLLSSHEDFKIVDKVPTGPALLQAVTQYRPQVVLVDLDLASADAVRILDDLAIQGDAPLILVLSGDETEEAQLTAARRGAQGILFKSQGTAVIANAIRAVNNGEVWFTRSIVGRIIREHAQLLRETRDRNRPAELLSEREREILTRLAQGMTNQQIADSLEMSLGTVKVHIRNIFQKFNLPNRTEAAVFALRERLIEPDEMNSSAPIKSSVR